MSSRLASLLFILGVIAVSVLGYVAIQQYIERVNSVSHLAEPTANTMPLVDMEALPEVTAHNRETFLQEHQDGILVDYTEPVSLWPGLSEAQRVVRYKKGCVPNNRPKETCEQELLAVLDTEQNKAILVQGLAQLPLVYPKIQQAHTALEIVEWLSAPGYEGYFNLPFTTLTPGSQPFDETGYHLQPETWRKLNLPQPQSEETESGYHIRRVAFMADGEKQIIELNETFSPKGNYQYELGAVLQRGDLIPIDIAH